ncbi:MAG: hypothetical protein PF961_14240 [Planctomycetota bacterium]|jgi:hypothetical protein|nr:hypothetical protein [Planctomycetota bacterium]
MEIDIRCQQATDRKDTVEMVETRLQRVLGRFNDRIRRVMATVSEEAQRHGRPRAYCAIDVQLNDGGSVQVRKADTRLIPAVSQAMNRLGRVVSDDRRLGARGFRAGAEG